MKCSTLHKNIIFFLEKELPAKEMEEMQKHFDVCPDCKAFAEDMKKTLGIIEDEKSPQVNPFFYTRLKARMESELEKETMPFWKPVMVKVIQPAFFTVLLIAGIYGGFKIATPVQTNMASTVYADNEIIPYLNEMQAEPLEDFLME